MTDPLEDQLRRLRPGALPAEVQTRLESPPSRESAPLRGKIVRYVFAAAAAAAVVALLLRHEAPPGILVCPRASPVFADSEIRRVQDVRPLAVVSEGLRAWELVEVNWVEESTHVSASNDPLAVQISHPHRTIVPVEILLD